MNKLNNFWNSAPRFCVVLLMVFAVESGLYTVVKDWSINGYYYVKSEINGG